ncbi:hypothetical protein EKI51_02045 [Corynebacterium sanguinis]|uniref:hypothetical protein n=1 Tax=Corynebacterium sanguinis TaxID=2594913 RepID=UPI0011A279D4|nr:hypothetical protein [Corynebacterium sanguinis]MCT1413905.1 hypothetical protein [Corynebacterium sanguinis]TVS25508.1 hypothetical protein EKI51_02045 [Corynebacterium sanguinis]
MDNTYGEPDWRSPLAESLVDLRSLPLDDPLRNLEKSGLVRVAGQIAMPIDLFAGLAFHEQRFVEALARGRNAYQAVLTGRSAARVLGMWVVSLSPEPVELALPSGEVPPTYRRDRSVACRRRCVDTWVDVYGVRTTPPIRTFIDIARDHGFAEGLIAADWLLANGFERDDLYRELAAAGPMRHVRVVRRCIALATAQSESPYESLARAVLIEAGVQGIELQVWAGGFRMDMLIGGWLAIEIDGDVKYSDDPGLTIRQEYERQKSLGNMGFVFLRYSPRHLRERPGDFVQQVLFRLEAAAPHGASQYPRQIRR